MQIEINTLTEIFRRRFKREEGWEVFVNWPRDARGALTSKLPLFLKEEHPDWLVQNPTAAGGNVTFNFIDANGIKLPPGQITSHLAPHGWSGEITLRVDGEPIVVQNVLIPGERGVLVLTFFAYKKEKVLTDFFTQVIRWSESKRDKDGKISIFSDDGISEEPRPKLTWEDVILHGSLAEDIRTNTAGFFKSGPRYKELGIAHKRGFLLTGPPGNGKTLTAKIIASDRKLNFGWLKLTSKIEDHIVSHAFRYCYEHAPCVLLIEDLDRIAHSGGITMSNILNQLDGLASGEGILVLATTNAPEKLDPALIHRPSRFDRVWRFGLPGEEQRLALLRRRGAKFFSEETMARVAEESGGFSMAYTQEIVTNSMIIAANADQPLGDVHLSASIAQIKSQYKNTWAREGLGKEEDATPMLGFLPEHKPPKARGVPF